MTDTFRVSATGAGVTYYPEFLARELGFFEDEGLVVETDVPTTKDQAAQQIAAEGAEAALGGIWRPLMYRGRLTRFAAFCQLCDRFGGVLLGREPVEGFAWSDLVGKLVLVPGGAPSPWLLLQGVLRRAGVDSTRINFVQDLTGAEMISLFRGGMGDYLLLAPPASDELVARGVASIATSFADAGEIPWSVYYATAELLDDPRNLTGRFTRAILRALRWTLGHDPTEAPEVLIRHFPKVPLEVAAESVRICKRQGIWIPTIRVNPVGLARWQEMLAEGHLIEAPIPYAEIVDSRAADWAEQT